MHLDLENDSLDGNRAGLLHLAASLVRAVLSPGYVDSPVEFVSDDGSIRIKSISCDNRYVAPPRESLAERATEYISKVGCICIALAFVLGMWDFLYRIDVYLAICAVVLVGISIFSGWLSSKLRRKRMKVWSASMKA